MPTFIKTGFWEKADFGLKKWLNLDRWLESNDTISSLVVTKDNTILGEYQYHAASPTEDTANDWRMYGDANGFYFQFCTVGNATKGSGTWVTKFTIQV